MVEYCKPEFEVDPVRKKFKSGDLGAFRGPFATDLLSIEIFVEPVNYIYRLMSRRSIMFIINIFSGMIMALFPLNLLPCSLK